MGYILEYCKIINLIKYIDHFHVTNTFKMHQACGYDLLNSTAFILS